MIKYLWCHRLDIFVTNDFVFSVSERSIQLEEHIPVYERKAKKPQNSKSTQYLLRVRDCINTNGMHHQLL